MAFLGLRSGVEVLFLFVGLVLLFDRFYNPVCISVHLSVVLATSNSEWLTPWFYVFPGVPMNGEFLLLILEGSCPLVRKPVLSMLPILVQLSTLLSSTLHFFVLLFPIVFYSFSLFYSIFLPMRCRHRGVIRIILLLGESLLGYRFLLDRVPLFATEYQLLHLLFLVGTLL